MRSPEGSTNNGQKILPLPLNSVVEVEDWLLQQQLCSQCSDLAVQIQARLVTILRQ